MGGDCLNTGCVPSKALIKTAKLLLADPPLEGLRREERHGASSTSPR